MKASNERHMPFLRFLKQNNYSHLLITGSQRAQSINGAAYAYSGLLDAGYRIIHLCGKKNYFSMKQKAPQDKRLILGLIWNKMGMV